MSKTLNEVTFNGLSAFIERPPPGYSFKKIKVRFAGESSLAFDKKMVDGYEQKNNRIIFRAKTVRTFTDSDDSSFHMLDPMSTHVLEITYENNNPVITYRPESGEVKIVNALAVTFTRKTSKNFNEFVHDLVMHERLFNICQKMMTQFPFLADTAEKHQWDSNLHDYTECDGYKDDYKVVYVQMDQEFIVYRGITLDFLRQAGVTNLDQQPFLVHPGYTSTSLNPLWARRFLDKKDESAFLHITVSPNVPFFPVMCNNLPMFAKESEIVFPPGTKVRFNDMRYDNGAWTIFGTIELERNRNKNLTVYPASMFESPEPSSVMTRHQRKTLGEYAYYTGLKKLDPMYHDYDEGL
jgi:hypothetical protein